ncbi:hypothetical protein [Desulfatibacillum alkenivorans]|jgi:hypothetical protein|uniref:hypothetical protein n=1 Tax=Desulfatibacillum alkenivorans TaxID=259354 RepID=UPI00147E61F0|nr:hypothetical protein [Desulfatibacillum alkenivorans]
MTEYGNKSKNKKNDLGKQHALLGAMLWPPFRLGLTGGQGRNSVFPWVLPESVLKGF